MYWFTSFLWWTTRGNEIHIQNLDISPYISVLSYTTLRYNVCSLERRVFMCLTYVYLLVDYIFETLTYTKVTDLEIDSMSMIIHIDFLIRHQAEWQLNSSL